ncbi:hypothetical protein PENTCL1PPCAC_19620, partial [Pristionchus entomophagus]
TADGASRSVPALTGATHVGASHFFASRFASLHFTDGSTLAVNHLASDVGNATRGRIEDLTVVSHITIETIASHMIWSSARGLSI